MKDQNLDQKQKPGPEAPALKDHDRIVDLVPPSSAKDLVDEIAQVLEPEYRHRIACPMCSNVFVSNGGGWELLPGTSSSFPPQVCWEAIVHWAGDDLAAGFFNPDIAKLAAAGTNFKGQK